MSPGSLYFIQEGPGGAIKIGWTDVVGVDNRRKAMQVGNSHELRVLGVIAGKEPDAELIWHDNFKHAHKRGEWFYPTPELLAAIADAVSKQIDLADPPDWHGPPAGAREVRAWLAEAELTMKEFAAHLGYDRSYVNYVIRHPLSMRPRIAYRIERATEGAIKAESLLVHYRLWTKAHNDKNMAAIEAAIQAASEAA